MKKETRNTQRNVEQRPQLLLLTPKIGTKRAKPNETHGGQRHDITKTELQPWVGPTSSLAATAN